MKREIEGLSPRLSASLNHRSGPDADDASHLPPAGAFEALGGREAIARLIDGLYDRIESDGLLRPAFSRDLTRERGKQKLFFEEWLGGAASYFGAEWPPGLKVAHGSVSISRGMADRWLEHFRHSLADVAGSPSVTAQILPYVSRLALALVNRPDEPVPGERLRCVRGGADLSALLRPPGDDAARGSAPAGHLMVTSREGPRLLLLAAVRGKTAAVEGLLCQRVHIDAPSVLPGSERTLYRLPLLPITPLCGALALRRATVARLLIEQGALYDVFTAAYLGDEAAVGELLDQEPGLASAWDPACDVGQVTALMHAAAGGQLEVARLLLARGARVEPHSVRLVRLAASRGHETLVDLLLEHRADAAPLGPGDWVLYPQVAQKLVARGADVNLPPGAWIGRCCTGNSGHKENVALAHALLRCGADVGARYKGRTALHCAAKAGFAQIAEALIEHGGDVNALTDGGRTPLDLVEEASRSIDRDPVRRLLLSHGARRSRSGSGR
ncbi:MAG TPA: ankyrin repeat domain-containing protein [Armatimonadota bacterium]|jgi:hemoglobin